jgi:hypothetical protein
MLGCRADPRSAYTGAAHEDRDRLPLPNAMDTDRGRRRNTSKITKPTKRRQTPCKFSQSRSLPRGESDISADAQGETPANVRSGTTSALGLARGFPTRHLFGDRESNDAPYPDFKDFTAQDHGRRLQEEDDEPQFTPGAADPTHGLLAPATSRLPMTPALTPGCFLPNFTLLRRPRPLYQGSRTTATSYRHTWVAQAPPGRCTVAALHPSPSSPGTTPARGKHRHTWCFCFGVFVCKMRDFRMVATSRATATGIHRLTGACWLLKVSTPRRGLKTRYAGCDG